LVFTLVPPPVDTSWLTFDPSAAADQISVTTIDTAHIGSYVFGLNVHIVDPTTGMPYPTNMVT